MEESDSGQQPKRCPCGFWGSPQTSGLCSKCYKAVVQEKTQDSLDAKAELMRDRQSAYTSHDSIGAASSSYRTTSCSQSSASDVEKAGELLRQAVRNSSASSSSSNVELANKSVPLKIDSSSTGTNNPSQDSEDAQKSVSSSSTSQTVSVSNGAEPSEKTVDTKSVQSESNDSNAEDSAKPSSLPATPEKRGMKRDSSTLDESTPESTPEKPGTKSKKRCAVCSCKLELAQRTIGRCRCDNVFCSLHRLPELHKCQFDHKEDGRREAREKMVKPTRHLGTSFKRLGSDS